MREVGSTAAAVGVEEEEVAYPEKADTAKKPEAMMIDFMGKIAAIVRTLA